MGQINDHAPLVVLAPAKQTPRAASEAIAQALREDGKEVRIVSNFAELVTHLREPRCFCVFIDEHFMPDVIVPLRAARQVSPVEWFIVLRSDTQNKSFNYRAIEAGVKGLLPPPLAPFHYVQRARQVLALFQAPRAASPQHVEVRPATGGERLHEPAVDAPRPATAKRGPLEGLELVRGSADYKPRRPDWVRIARAQKSREFQSLASFRAQCELDLLDLVKGEKRASLSLMSLRVRDPLVSYPPAEMRSVVSSDLLEDLAIQDAAAFPDALSALELGSAVIVPDFRKSTRFTAVSAPLLSRGIVSRASIPIHSGGRVVGMIKAQFNEPVNARLRAIVEDLVPFSRQLAGSFAKIDFLERVYAAAAL